MGLLYDSVWINTVLQFKCIDLCSLKLGDDRSRLTELAEPSLDLEKWSQCTAGCEMKHKTERQPKRDKKDLLAGEKAPARIKTEREKEGELFWFDE